MKAGAFAATISAALDRSVPVSKRLQRLAADDSPFRRRIPKSPFERSRGLELGYGRQLARIARHIDDLVRGIIPEDAEEVPEHIADQIARALRHYAEILDPWAEAVAKRVLNDVDRQDYAAWQKHAGKMGAALREEIARAPTGQIMQDALAEQVTLIKSIPLEAAMRVHQLAIEGLSTGRRAKEIADDILKTGEVTRSRAMLIARTEVTRAAEALTQARALSIGSPGYYWATAKDKDVRPSHQGMEGKFVPWDRPPTLDGLTGHAGALPNCRCTTLVVLPPRFQMAAATAARRRR